MKFMFEKPFPQYLYLFVCLFFSLYVVVDAVDGDGVVLGVTCSVQALPLPLTLPLILGDLQIYEYNPGWDEFLNHSSPFSLKILTLFCTC